MNRAGIRFNARSGLGSDVYWMVQRFFRNDLRWYHLLINRDVFATFTKEMQRIEERIVALPFWCLCDGVKDDEGSHRHMILACDHSGQFEKIWNEKVRLPAETCKKIETPFQLVRTIVYVSTPKASCDKGIPEDMQHREDSHFHINRPLHEHSIAFLCTLYKEGIGDLCIEQFRDRNVMDWEKHAVSHNNKWAVPMKHTGFKFLDCVLPVEKNLEPSVEETDMYVYLNAERKLYFKENEQLLNLTDEEWIVHQVKKGNTFRAIESELYFLTAEQQNIMNQIKQTT